MFKLNITKRDITMEQYKDIEKHFEEQQKMFRLYAVKTKLSQKLWQKKCVKHYARNSSFQGVWQTDWEKIENSKRR